MITVRRLARHLITLCSALSLLLCVAVCVVGVRGYFLTDLFQYVRSAGARPALQGQKIWEHRRTAPIFCSGGVGGQVAIRDHSPRPLTHIWDIRGFRGLAISIPDPPV